MINLNRSDIYDAAHVSSVNRVESRQKQVDAESSQFQPGVAGLDTVSISDTARAMMQGHPVEQKQDTYDNMAKLARVKTNASSLVNLEQQEQRIAPEIDNREKDHINIDNFFSEAMKGVLDSRMGIDKEKIKEIEAMMEEVAKDDSLSPEQKAKKLEELQKLMDEVIEEAIEKLQQQDKLAAT